MQRTEGDQAPDELPPLLNLKETATLFGLSPRSVEVYVREGRFPVEPVWIGRHRRWRLADVRRYLEGGQ